MSVLRCFCSVISLAILFQFAQGSEPPQEINLPKAPVETLDRLKEKLAQNSGRDANIKCEIADVNRIFKTESWGESIYEFNGLDNLSIITSPPKRAAFRQWLINRREKCINIYSLREMSEGRFLFPIERNCDYLKPAAKQKTVSNLKPYQAYWLNLIQTTLAQIKTKVIDFEKAYTIGYRDSKACFLLLAYEEVEKGYQSNRLYEDTDCLIWEIIPQSDEFLTQILIKIDKATLQPTHVIKNYDESSTHYFKVINYELK